MTSPWKQSFEEAFPDGAPAQARPPGTLIRGTCYFVDRVAAAAYYLPYYAGLSKWEFAQVLTAKERNGEIVLGKPPGIAADKLILLDGGTRYGIIEG